MYTLTRAKDGRRVEFYNELRNGHTVYIIREGAASQDSVTPDKDAVDAFREGLIRDGFIQAPF